MLHYSLLPLHRHLSHVRIQRGTFSSFTIEGYEARARDKERKNLEAVRRASLIDEESRQMSALEVALGHLVPDLRLLRGSPLRVQRLLWYH